MTGNDLKSVFLAAAFVVPTFSLKGWKELQFNKIPKNTVTVIDKKLQIKVEASASPLVYKLPEIIQTKSIEFTYNVVIKSNGGLISTPADKNSNTSSEKLIFPEDFVLRIGLVAKGEKILGWLQRQIAANWVLELFNLAPKNVGLDKIYFYNIATSSKLVGISRQHPKSDLMMEEVVGSFPENKKIHFPISQS